MIHTAAVVFAIAGAVAVLSAQSPADQQSTLRFEKASIRPALRNRMLPLVARSPDHFHRAGITFLTLSS